MQFVWRPYADAAILVRFPADYEDSVHWRACTPLLCMAVIEWHHADRVLRQFGFAQHIPQTPVCIDDPHGSDLRGAPTVDDWRIEYYGWSILWARRARCVAGWHPDTHPFHVASAAYYQWYWRHTRAFIRIATWADPPAPPLDVPYDAFPPADVVAPLLLFPSPSVSDTVRSCFPCTHIEGRRLVAAVDDGDDEDESDEDDDEDEGDEDDDEDEDDEAGEGDGRSDGGSDHGGGDEGGDGGRDSGGDQGGDGGSYISRGDDVYTPQMDSFRPTYEGSGSRGGGRIDDGPLDDADLALTFAPTDLLDQTTSGLSFTDLLQPGDSVSFQPDQFTTPPPFSIPQGWDQFTGFSAIDAFTQSQFSGTTPAPPVSATPITTWYPYPQYSPQSPPFVPGYDQHFRPQPRPHSDVHRPRPVQFDSPPPVSEFGTRPGPPPSVGGRGRGRGTPMLFYDGPCYIEGCELSTPHYHYA